MNKTERCYGAIVARIRAVARKRKTFSREHLPFLGRAQATSLLQWMKTKGELERVQKGSGGCKPRVSMYRMTKLARADER